MHQRMIPFLYPVVEIYREVRPYIDTNAPDLDLAEYERSFFQEDGSKDSLSILSLMKDLRILPQPWYFQRCGIERYIAGRSNIADPQSQHTGILATLASIGRQIFPNIRPGQLSRFSYVLQLIDTDGNGSVADHLQQMDVRLLHATRSPWTAGLYYH